MQVRKLVIASLLAGTASVGLAAPAHALCDAYSGGCPSTPPGKGSGNPIGGGTEQPVGGNETPPASTPPGGGPDGGTTGGPERGDEGNPGRTVTDAATLPFTGGELVLLTTIGVGALAGGTALVVAGRRKTS